MQNLTVLRRIQEHFPKAAGYTKLNEGQGVEIHDSDNFVIALVDSYTFYNVYERSLLNV